MTEYQLLIEKFFSCMRERDYRGMAQCYHPDVRFSDPLFPELQGREVAALWHMLCFQMRDLEINVKFVKSPERKVYCRWEAFYTPPGSTRRVHHVVDSEFEFREGRIYRHRDRFDFKLWSKQALGWLGTWLGWASLTQSVVQNRSVSKLKDFIRKHPSYMEG